MAKTELQNLLEEIDVEDFLCHLGVDYKITHGSSGVQANIRECPRCGGTDSKVYMGIESGLGNCFHGSCQGEPGYNLFTFASSLLGSGKAAYKELISYTERVGWVPMQRRSPTFEPPSDVSLPKSYPIPINGKNLRYLSERGISIDVASFLQLRFCKRGEYEYSLLGETQQQTYDNRVIIPIYDEHENLVTFQGRDVTGHAHKKYLFPPGLSGTGRFLYNVHRCIGFKEIVIGEGAFDVAAIIMAFDHHIENVGVVGSFGKNLSTGHSSSSQLSQLLFLKQRGLEKITIMWDGEMSALNEACKTALMLKSYGFESRVAVLPKDKDPNEVDGETVRDAYRSSVLATSLTMAKLRLGLMH